MEVPTNLGESTNCCRDGTEAREDLLRTVLARLASGFYLTSSAARQTAEALLLSRDLA